MKEKECKYDVKVYPELCMPEYSNTIADGVPLLRMYRGIFEVVSNPHGTYKRRLLPNELLIFGPTAIVPPSNVIGEKIISYVDNGCSLEEAESQASFDYCNFTIDADLPADDVIVFKADLTDLACCTNPDATNYYNHGKEIGRYYIGHGSLITSDLCHTRETMSILYAMIDYIIACGYKQSRESKVVSFPKRKVTVGCDPEFEYVNKEGYVSTAFPYALFEFTGGANSGGNEEVGIDGGGEVLEFRPRPTRRPSEMVSNVRKLMERVKYHHLSIVGKHFPIGCHLHFGVGFSLYAPNNLVELLDYFLGTPCYVMNGSGRGGYRELGQVRDQAWGFEYRSLPAGVISDPEFFRIVLKIGRQIVQRYMDGKPFMFNTARAVYGAKDIPDYDAYRYICGLTKREYDYFNTFISSYNDNVSYRKSVIALWEIEGAAQTVGNGFLIDHEDDSDEGYNEDRGETTSRDREYVNRTIDLADLYLDFEEVFSSANRSYVELQFREYWEREVVDDITGRLIQVCEDSYSVVMEGVKRTHRLPGMFTLIGLRESRGLVVDGFVPPLAPIECSSAQHLEISTLGLAPTGIGLSYAFRSGRLKREYPTYYDMMCTAIANSWLHMAVSTTWLDAEATRPVDLRDGMRAEFTTRRDRYAPSFDGHINDAREYTTIDLNMLLGSRSSLDAPEIIVPNPDSVAVELDSRLRCRYPTLAPASQTEDEPTE